MRSFNLFHALIVIVAIGIAAQPISAQENGNGNASSTTGSGAVVSSSTTGMSTTSGVTSGGVGVGFGGTASTSGMCIDGGFGCDFDNGTEVPEPSSLIFFGAGAAAILAARRSRKGSI